MSAAASPDKRVAKLYAFVEKFVDNTPPGSALFLQGVSWEGYERYLYAVDRRLPVRLSYDEGRLEIMSLSSASVQKAWDPMTVTTSTM
jgi:hypothetical protein